MLKKFLDSCGKENRIPDALKWMHGSQIMWEVTISGLRSFKRITQSPYKVRSENRSLLNLDEFRSLQSLDYRSSVKPKWTIWRLSIRFCNKPKRQFTCNIYSQLWSQPNHSSVPHYYNTKLHLIWFCQRIFFPIVFPQMGRKVVKNRKEEGQEKTLLSCQ